MTRASRKTAPITTPQLAVCVFEIQRAEGEIQLLPAGTFRAADGRPLDADAWRLDGEIAARVIRRAESRANDLVIDYEHQTLHTEWNGQPAPAAGWFRQLAFREGEGLYTTDVSWTDRAQGMIAAGEYRYISPVFLYLPESGEVTEILSAALTNNPGLDGMQELVSRAAARFSIEPSPEEDDTVNPELLKLLGLSEDASEEEIKAAVTRLNAQAEALAALRQKLEVDENVDLVEHVAALRSQGSGQPDPSKYVPVGVVDELRGELASLRSQINDREVGELVDVAMSDGRLLPAQEEWARELGKSDIAALRKYLDGAQPIAALRGQQTGGKSPEGEGGDGELTDNQLAICKRMGLTPDEYKAAL